MVSYTTNLDDIPITTLIPWRRTWHPFQVSSYQVLTCITTQGSILGHTPMSLPIRRLLCCTDDSFFFRFSTDCFAVRTTVFLSFFCLSFSRSSSRQECFILVDFLCNYNYCTAFFI